MVPSPATAPEIMPSTDGLPRSHHSNSIQVSTPEHAARCVATTAKPARELAPSAAPPLKPDPPAPQKAGADHRERQVIGREIVGAVAAPGSEEIAGDEPADACV